MTFQPGPLQFTSGGAAFQITSPGTITGDVIENIDGAVALCLQAAFKFGSGNGQGGVKAYVQTSLDQGQSWIDIACFTFAQASATKVVNLSGLTPLTAPLTPSQAALADNTCVDGIIGGALRAVVVVEAGSAYQNGALNITAEIR